MILIVVIKILWVCNNFDRCYKNFIGCRLGSGVWVGWAGGFPMLRLGLCCAGCLAVVCANLLLCLGCVLI